LTKKEKICVRWYATLIWMHLGHLYNNVPWFLWRKKGRLVGRWNVAFIRMHLRHPCNNATWFLPRKRGRFVVKWYITFIWMYLGHPYNNVPSFLQGVPFTLDPWALLLDYKAKCTNNNVSTYMWILNINFLGFFFSCKVECCKIESDCKVCSYFQMNGYNLLI
jgi:hypothetical protein